jgi:NADPH:quinone reductase-like Zn-dependent oxidoreductase
LNLKRGDNVIVHGASGAVGHAGVQLAKCEVRECSDGVRREGSTGTQSSAGRGIDGRTGDIAAAARAFAPKGADCGAGFAGGDALEKCLVRFSAAESSVSNRRGAVRNHVPGEHDSL